MNPRTTTPPETLGRLQQLAAAGQSIWLDYIKRSMFGDGSLARMIEEDGLRGMTSNPAIFEKAIAGSNDYARDLAAAGVECARNPKAVFERLAIADVRSACDALQPVYEATKRIDGYVSLEVAPDLAMDRAATIEEARRLWKSVGRPNVMIKVPGTPPCIPAVRQLLGEGINVNITLLFSVDAYLAVMQAWLDALEEIARKGGDVSSVASVASFFVSRIDSLLDPRLEEIAKKATSPADRARAEALFGKVAIANAKVAYQHYLEMKKGARWQALEKKGAMPQRLLWASTSTKNPRYRDVLYAEELIGSETVDTMPPQTFEAFKDHGVVKPTLSADVEGARKLLAELERTGQSLKAATDKLLVDGVKLFKDAFDQLLAAVAKHGAAVEPAAASAAPSRGSAGTPPPSAAASTSPAISATAIPSGARLTAKLPAELQKAVDEKLADWKNGGKVKRLWASDAKLWTGGDEASWTGWLTIVDEKRRNAPRYKEIFEEAKAAGFKHVCLLGMGGSSLCPEVWAETFGPQPGAPRLVVLDSTDPQQLLAVERSLDLARTLFCVSSKSGSTLEPNIFKGWFFERVKQMVGPDRAGRQFIAVTDPGSQLEQEAKREGFRRVFPGLKSIGGRYSALSDFGLVPAALMGLDVGKLLDRAADMKQACTAADPAANPGVLLGLILGCAAKAGRDKVTIVASPSIVDLGAWIEQLFAESTGKIGRGLIPVDREKLAVPASYGPDRAFLCFEAAGETGDETRSILKAIENDGHPVVRIALRDGYDLAAEFFRLEIATAAAGEVLGIHPFDQPDVEASKIATKQLTAAFEQSGSLPAETPLWSGDGVRLFADERNAAELGKSASGSPSLTSFLRAHFARLGKGDYAGFLAYVDMSPTHEALLQEMRHAVRDRRRVATVLGFGPRFLHSTGQAYKGGPNSGVFLQITADDARDVPVPGAKYTFGVVKAAQARGDFAVLAERGRRALRVHLAKDAGGDVTAGLARLRDAVRAALGDGR
jgi:transaldolase/glucose-6-phosphate isomerase